MKKFAFSAIIVFALFAVLSPALFATESKEAKLVIQLTLDKSSPVSAYRLQNGTLTFAAKKFTVTEIDHHDERITATSAEVETDAGGVVALVFTGPARYLIEDSSGLFFEVIKVSPDGTICFFENEKWNCVGTRFLLATFPVKSVTGHAAYIPFTKTDFDTYHGTKETAKRMAEQIRVLLRK